MNAKLNFKYNKAQLLSVLFERSIVEIKRQFDAVNGPDSKLSNGHYDAQIEEKSPDGVLSASVNGQDSNSGEYR